MSLPRFFISEDQIDGKNVLISGESAFHISRSLRMKKGEKIVLCDGKGTDHECCLTSFTQDSVGAEVISSYKNLSEPSYRAVLYQALPKSDKPEFIVQKAVELGAYEIVFFESERCVSRPDHKSIGKKLERFNKIALEAAKQSGRGILPNVRYLASLESVAEEAAGNGTGFMCFEDEKAVFLRQFLDDRKIKPENSVLSFIIGSEGGFSEKEAELCKNRGIHTVSLGKRILRTETAGLYVLSSLSFYWSE